MSFKDRTVEVWSRSVGFFRPTSNWNEGKQEEFKDRKEYLYTKKEELHDRKTYKTRENGKDVRSEKDN